MADRTHPIRIEFCVSEYEHQLIKSKMAIDGYIIKTDYTKQKKLAAAVSRTASSINHICRCIKSTGYSYDDDIAIYQYSF